MSSLNAQQLAHEIARGLVSINPSRLKKYGPNELKALLAQLNAEQRKIRAKQVSADHLEEIKEKNRYLQNIQQAITIISGYAKKYNIGS
ncbi:hypothetical protein U27_07059 [Candidatus Vecturithrix granuli]|uniref:Uncharacterized protein n=1 Tax=Vecturithrix granuli TaxID=1499967 RepID=A0A081C666_VECG1|nr:hypothetical protein U27_07059 [Candidatus Vecturithrix granuli]